MLSDRGHSQPRVDYMQKQSQGDSLIKMPFGGDMHHSQYKNNYIAY